MFPSSLFPQQRFVDYALVWVVGQNGLCSSAASAQVAAVHEVEVLVFETGAEALGLLQTSFSEFALCLALQDVLDVADCEAAG